MDNQHSQQEQFVQTGELHPATAAPRSRKGNARDIEDRIEAVAELIAKRARMSDIKAFCRENFGLGYRQAAEYVSRAREKLRSDAEKPREDLLAEATAFLEGAIRDPAAGHRAKIAAQRELLLLHGVYRQQRAKTTHVDNEADSVDEDFYKTIPMEQLRVMYEIHMKLRAWRQENNRESRQ